MELLKTGIAGLDEILGGGVPKGHIILIAGGAGSGKSTLAMQMLHNGAELYNEHGIYVSFEESVDEIRENFSNYSWNLDKIDILSLIPEKLKTVEGAKYVLPAKLYTKDGKEYEMKSFSIDFIEEILKNIVEEKNAKRIVIDSISSLAFQIKDMFMLRQELLNIKNMLRRLGVTAFLITEIGEDEKISRFGVEEFIVNGVIKLYNIKKGSKRVRGIEVLKMRGIKHSQQICLLDIAEKGIVVYPQENLY